MSVEEMRLNGSFGGERIARGPSRGQWSTQAFVCGRGGAIDCKVGRRILIAGRRSSLLQSVEASLVEAGHQVEVVTDGLRALKRAQELPPDLLATQILLPSLGGLELIRRLRADPATRSMRILVFSILDAERRALQAGADRFVGYPLRSERLVAAIVDLLGSP